MAQKASALQPTVRPLSIFVAHTDCTSASHALAALSAHCRQRGQHFALRPMLWRFDQLTEPRWSQTALHDALRAECVLLAMDREDACQATVDGWLQSLREKAGDTTLSLIVAVRNEELWHLSLAGHPQPATSAAIATPPREVIGTIATKRPAAA